MSQNDLWDEFIVHVPDERPGIEKISLCGLCGNTGRLHQIGVRSPAGILLPAIDRPCICPNGRALKASEARGAAGKTIRVIVEGGVVQDVENLPKDWSYEIEDHDTRFHNYYECVDCDERWEDDNCDSAHNDRCPKCNHEIEPYKSESV